MKLYEKEIFVPLIKDGNLLEYFSEYISTNLSNNEFPVRFVITKTTSLGYFCEVGIMKNNDYDRLNSIFSFRKRTSENCDKFNAVLIIPTGIGAEIGGHCGDGNAVAKLISSACDTLITHPNVVNASDVNELCENALYVEGSAISRLLMGQIGLQKVRSNKILMLMDKHDDKLFNDEVINAVSTARATVGIDCDVCEMEEQVKSESVYSKSGRCVGKTDDLENLFKIIEKYKNDYDAIGLSTFIKTPDSYHEEYFKDKDMVNPWGGVEAILTHSVMEVFGLPCAHSPMLGSREIMNIELGIVDPRKASETSSVTFMHCILKGLHRSPKIVPSQKGLNVTDISCIIIPDKCVGLPTLAALEQGIPVIVVKGNKNIMDNDLDKLPFKKNKLIYVESYLEAVGVMNALKIGLSIESVKRPLNYTKIL